MAENPITEQTVQETAILIVDDEVSLRNTFSTFLKRAGYETVVAVASFEDAVQEVTSQMFDLIICDIFLESHSGIDLLKRFRQLGVICPVIIITGYPHVETASEAVRLGAFDYLAKPVEKEPLLKATRLALQQYRLEREKKAAEQARARYRRFLETLFKSVSDTIISIDQDFTILKLNVAAAQLFQDMQPPLCEGGDLRLFLQHNKLSRFTGHIAKVIETNTELIDHRVEWKLGDTVKTLSICISPLGEGTKEQSGCVLVIRDMTHLKQKPTKERTHLHRLIGASPAMQSVFLMLENIGKVDTSVLITGASGTGKELAVHALHQESARHNKPLIKVDCTAIPDNLLESELFGHKKGSFTGADENRMGRILQADGGTLFLDEIGDISTIMQLRLLRFLQEKTFYPVGKDKEIQVDVRVVAATHVDLKEKVKEGSFREDLYFRLLIIDIHLPPLCQREGDIPLLTNHFIRVFAHKLAKPVTGISDEALQLLCSYKWPGNVRQLQHSLERACILCQDTTITSEHLPVEVHTAKQPVQVQATPPPTALDKKEGNSVRLYSLTPQEQQTAENIITALKKAGGNKAKAARILKIDRSTLYRKMRELHIDIDMFAL